MQLTQCHWTMTHSVSHTIIISVTLSDSVTVTVTECDTVSLNNDTLSVTHHYHQCHTQWQCHSVWHSVTEQWHTQCHTPLSSVSHSVTVSLSLSVTVLLSLSVTQCRQDSQKLKVHHWHRVTVSVNVNNAVRKASDNVRCRWQSSIGRQNISERQLSNTHITAALKHLHYAHDKQ